MYLTVNISDEDIELGVSASPGECPVLLRWLPGDLLW